MRKFWIGMVDALEGWAPAESSELYMIGYNQGLAIRVREDGWLDAIDSP